MPIVCATDFSPCSEAACDLAVSLARIFARPLHLIHVIQAPVLAAPEVAAPAGWGAAINDAAEAALAGRTDELRSAGVDATWEVTFGSPAELVLERARSMNAEAIVLGTHGRRGPVRFFLGSVAEHVAREATCPVFVAHAGGRPPALADQGPLSIVLVLDGTPGDEAVLAWAARLRQSILCAPTALRLLSPPAEASRLGLEEPGADAGPSQELLDLVGGELAARLGRFEGLADIARRFVVVHEGGRVDSLVCDIDMLRPSLVAVAASPSARSGQRPGLRPADLLRAVTVPTVCVPRQPETIGRRLPIVRTTPPTSNWR